MLSSGFFSFFSFFTSSDDWFYLGDGVKLSTRGTMTGESLKSSGDPCDGCLHLRQRQWFSTGEVKSANRNFERTDPSSYVRTALYRIYIGLNQRLPWYVNVVSVRFHVPLECRVRWQALLLCLVFRIRLEPTSIVPARLIGIVKSSKIAACTFLHIQASP